MCTHLRGAKAKMLIEPSLRSQRPSMMTGSAHVLLLSTNVGQAELVSTLVAKNGRLW